MKAVVLARGAGRRMREIDGAATLTSEQSAAAAAGLKALMPIGDGPAARPFLDYVLSELAAGGVTRVCLVVGPGSHDAVRAYSDGLLATRLSMTVAVQDVADGTARAVVAAESFTAGDAFLVLNADNVYPPEVVRALVELDGPGLPAFEPTALALESGFPPARVREFALVAVDGHGHLRSIVEKPSTEEWSAAGADALVSMNVWRFDARIFDACRAVPLSARGEYELPQAVALSLDRGVLYAVVRASGAVVDLSRQGDVAMVAARLAGRQVRL